MLFFFVVVAALASNALADNPCPAGWSHYEADDTCLKAYKTAQNYDNAMKTCQAEDSDLVRVSSDAKANILYDMVGDGHIWMGVSDLKEEGKFVFSDGSPLTAYQPWNGGEPNDYGSGEDCAHLIGREHSTRMKWNDLFCVRAIAFVCEKSQDKCPEGYRYYQADDSCLKAFKTGQNYNNALKSCQSEDADLVRISSDAKANVLYDMVGDGHIWMGVSDLKQEGQFVYTDGSALTAYQPWNGGEPNDYGSGEDCAHLIGREHSKRMKWNDLFCDRAIAYVCEIRLNEPEPEPEIIIDPVPEPEPEPVNPCPEGYNYYEADDSCLKAFKTGKNYNDALASCQSQKADLVRITSDAKATILYDMVGDGHIWMGVSDLKQEGKFVYTDGSALTAYQPWNGGEPNDYGSGEDCAHLIGREHSKRMKWNDLFCDRAIAYVCEIRLNEPEVQPPKPVACDKKWKLHEQSGMCVKAFSKRGSFDKSKAFCKKKGGELVTLFKSQEQADFVNGLTKKGTPYWIGIVDTNLDGIFGFIDGILLGDYNGFKKGQPDNRKGDEKCVQLKNGKWSDKRCKQSKRPICQKKPQ